MSHVQSTTTVASGVEYQAEYPQYGDSPSDEGAFDEAVEDTGRGKILHQLQLKRKQDAIQGAKGGVRSAIEAAAARLEYDDEPISTLIDGLDVGERLPTAVQAVLLADDEVAEAIANANERSRGFRFGEGRVGSGLAQTKVNERIKAARKAGVSDDRVAEILAQLEAEAGIAEE